MRHRINNQSFGRKGGPKKALVRGLVNSLVEHGRIRTTLTKAKYIRPVIERAVTLGQRENGLHARRMLLSMYPNKNTVDSLMNDISPRFKGRPGGYTRILKLGPRPGDMADMAYIQFVDYILPDTKSGEEVKGADTNLEKLVVKRKADHKKSVRKMQNESRRRSK